MTSALLPIPAAILYISAAGLLWRGLGSGQPLRGGARTGVFALAAGAVILHAALLYGDLFQSGLNLGFSSAASLVAWAVVLLFLAAVLFQPIESLGPLILPIAAAMLLFEWLWPTRHLTLPGASPVQAAHIVISLLAYSLLSIAVVQGVVLGLQERALHRRQAGGFFAQPAAAGNHGVVAVPYDRSGLRATDPDPGERGIFLRGVVRPAAAL